MKTIWVIRDCAGSPLEAYEDVTEALSNLYDIIFESTYYTYHTNNGVIDENDMFCRLVDAIRHCGVQATIQMIWKEYEYNYFIEEVNLIQN